MTEIFNQRVDDGTWVIYECGPIDMNWEFCVDFFDLFRQDPEFFANQPFYLVNLIGSWTTVLYLLTKMGLGHKLDNVKILPIPMPIGNNNSDGIFEFGFVVKQCNKGGNGTTWVASPVALPWLDYDNFRVEWDFEYAKKVNRYSDKLK